jgi:hypothetical protein
MMRRKTLGYVQGARGRFSTSPFYRLHLPVHDACPKLDQLLQKAATEGRVTATVTASFHQPDRLRITMVNAPDYEQRAAAQYVRGDVIRIQGRVGVSCGMDVSGQFGVPLLREKLGDAVRRAKEFVELRVPNRKHDVVEFWPDVDLLPNDDIVSASVAAAGAVLPKEDFSDWEK